MWTFAGYACLYLVNHYFIDQLHLPVYWNMFVVVVVLVLELSAAGNPSVAAAIIANRRSLSFIMMLAIAITAVPLVIGSAHRLTPDSALILFQFVLQGAVVGVVFRVLVLALYTRLLQGDSTEVYRVLLLAGLTTFVWLFPFGEAHRVYVGSYVLGFGAGFWSHQIVRQRNRALDKRSAILLALMERGGNSAIEVGAAELLMKRKWRRLDALVTAERQPSTLTILIKTAGEVTRGLYAAARTSIDRELGRKDHDSRYGGGFYLLRALCAANLELPDEMQENLSRAMDREPDCVLSLLTRSLQIAEAMPVADSGDGSPESDEQGREAMHLLNSALQLHEAGVNFNPASLIIGSTVPVTDVFVRSVQAYVLFKLGHRRQARHLLSDCVKKDPDSSLSYLYLGELYIAELLRYERQANESSGGSPPSSKTSNSRRVRRRAKLCLQIAVRVDHKPNSATKRRARELLEAYDANF
jgi:hypothetical protein